MNDIVLKHDSDIIRLNRLPITFSLKDQCFAIEERFAARVDEVLTKGKSAEAGMSSQMHAAREMTQVMFEKDVATLKAAFRVAGDNIEHHKLVNSDPSSTFWQSQEIEGIEEALADFRKKIGLLA